MQKSMELMDIKLANVISDILGKSGQTIISAIIQGERNTSKLAELADPRCKASRETIEKSLDAKPLPARADERLREGNRTHRQRVYCNSARQGKGGMRKIGKVKIKEKCGFN